MKISLADFTAKVGRENVFKHTIGSESFHVIRSDYWFRVLKFATSKRVTINITMFPHRNIHEYT
jgi:hypothetical protein